MWGGTSPCVLFCEKGTPLHPPCVPATPPCAPLCWAGSLFHPRFGQDSPSVPCSMGKGPSSSPPVGWDFPLCLVLCGRDRLPPLVCGGTSPCALFCREGSVLHPLFGLYPLSVPCSVRQGPSSIRSLGRTLPLCLVLWDRVCFPALCGAGPSPCALFCGTGLPIHPHCGAGAPPPQQLPWGRGSIPLCSTVPSGAGTSTGQWSSPHVPAYS